jgi:hypothetical protein
MLELYGKNGFECLTHKRPNGGGDMKLKQGETYICTEPGCRAEITVRRGADSACPGKYVVRCCCGKEMAREDLLVFAKPKGAAQRA